MKPQYWKRLVDVLEDRLTLAERGNVLLEDKLANASIQLKHALDTATERRELETAEMQQEIDELNALVRDRGEEIIRLKGSDSQTYDLVFANDQLQIGIKELKAKLAQIRKTACQPQTKTNVWEILNEIRKVIDD